LSKNCRIAIIVAIIAFVALLVVLASTIFCVKQVQIVWYKTPSDTLSAIKDSDFLEKSGVENCSVFLLDRERAVNTLENTYPDVRIINVEVVYPNILKVHAVEREKVYAIKVKDNKFAIVDEYFKVLEVVDSFDSTKSNAVYINTDLAQDLAVKRADSINILGKTVWNNIYNAFLELERDLNEFRAIVADGELTEDSLTINTHQGVVIELEKPFSNTRAKMRLALNTFDLMTITDYPNSVISVFVNDKGKLESRIYKNN